MYVMGYRALEYTMCVYVYIYIIYRERYVYIMGCGPENTTEDQVEHQVPKKWECH